MYSNIFWLFDTNDPAVKLCGVTQGENLPHTLSEHTIRVQASYYCIVDMDISFLRYLEFVISA